MKYFLFYRFHAWYDSLPEPRRFFTFLIPMIIVITFGQLGPFPYNMFALLLMGIIALNRIHWIHKDDAEKHLYRRNKK